MPLLTGSIQQSVLAAAAAENSCQTGILLLTPSVEIVCTDVNKYLTGLEAQILAGQGEIRLQQEFAYTLQSAH